MLGAQRLSCTINSRNGQTGRKNRYLLAAVGAATISALVSLVIALVALIAH